MRGVFGDAASVTSFIHPPRALTAGKGGLAKERWETGTLSGWVPRSGCLEVAKEAL